jgi:hypothetical protein
MLVAHHIRTAGLALLIALAAAPLSAHEPVLGMTKADCARLVAYVPAPGVDYQPGVDVRGETVVPADLESNVEIALPERFLIPIEVDLAQRLGLPWNPDRFQAEAFIGVVEVRGERLYFNGQPLQNEEKAELAALCRELLSGED